MAVRGEKGCIVWCPKKQVAWETANFWEACHDANTHQLEKCKSTHLVFGKEQGFTVDMFAKLRPDSKSQQATESRTKATEESE